MALLYASPEPSDHPFIGIGLIAALVGLIVWQNRRGVQLHQGAAEGAGLVAIGVMVGVLIASEDILQSFLTPGSIQACTIAFIVAAVIMAAGVFAIDSITARRLR